MLHSRISVIIPIHNSEQYLRSCLSSISQQTEKGIQVIMIDDASDDDSLQIAEEFSKQDPRFQIISFRENKGVNAARNAALDKAIGTYIAFCDSDDTVPPDAYQKLADAADKGKLDIVIGAHEDHNDEGFCALRPLRRNTGNLDSFMQTSTVWERVWRRSFIEKNHLRYENFLMGGDAVFVANAYRCRPRYGFLNDCIYHYWTHNKGNTLSIVNTVSNSYFQDCLRCCDEIAAILRKVCPDEADDYVYVKKLAYLRSRFMRIIDGKEAEPAFDAFKLFLKQFDWSVYPDVFRAEFGMSLEEMEPLSALEYHLRCGNCLQETLEPRDQVLVEFRKGKIGFQYILQYMKAWIGYKLGRASRLG